MKTNTTTVILVALGALIVGAIIGQQMQKMQSKKDLDKPNGNNGANEDKGEDE